MDNSGEFLVAQWECSQMKGNKGTLVFIHTGTNVTSVVCGGACFSHFFVAFLGWLFIGVFLLNHSLSHGHAEVLSSAQAVRCPMEMLMFRPELCLCWLVHYQSELVKDKQ